MLSRHFGSRQLGEASAILAGDYAAALALEVLASSKAPPDRVARSLTMFAEIQQNTIFGQQIDLGGRSDDVEWMHDLKTGSYTVRGPILLGATLAGASSAQKRALAKFAQPLGVAFQLRDDLLGTFGDSGETGKPVGSDVRAGKRTSLVAEALRLAKPKDRRTIEATLGQSDAPLAAVTQVARLYEQCGARAAVERRLEELAQQAHDALAKARVGEKPRSWLEGATRALTARSR